MVSIPYPLGIAHSPPRVILNTPLTQRPGRFLPRKDRGFFHGEDTRALLPLIAHSSFLSIFQFSKTKNYLALHLIAPESVTNVTKYDETFLIKTMLVTLVTLVTLFFKNKKTFSKNITETLLDMINIFFYQTGH